MVLQLWKIFGNVDREQITPDGSRTHLGVVAEGCDAEPSGGVHKVEGQEIAKVTD